MLGHFAGPQDCVAVVRSGENVGYKPQCMVDATPPHSGLICYVTHSVNLSALCYTILWMLYGDEEVVGRVVACNCCSQRLFFEVGSATEVSLLVALI